MADGIKANLSNLAVYIVPRIINAGGIRQEELHVGISKDDTEGSPGSPCMRMSQIGYWRFRRTLNAGTRAFQINVKQAANQSPRPSVIIRKNLSMGINSDITIIAPSDTGWVVVGPQTISVTNQGFVWIELHNNYETYPPTAPAYCYWDHVVVT
jgi:hypothetical protein